MASMNPHRFAERETAESSPSPATTAVLSPAPGRPRVEVRSAHGLPSFLKNGLGLALVAATLVTLVVLVGLGGWSYYWTPQDVRAYTELHPLLRPSGAVGQTLGVSGLSLMVLMHLYSLRKRVPALRRLGNVRVWLEFHIFCGVLGPVLITFHTSFKFNGIISVAYWSMLIVVLSGFVGRYLYARIPRSIRGHELGHAELEERVEEVRRRVAELDLAPELAARIEALERTSIPRSADETTWLGLFFGETRMRWRLRSVARDLHRAGGSRRLVSRQLAVLGERDLLLRRLVYLKKTRQLFDLWHVYHKPLAVLMAVVVVAHVAVVWYLGYTFFSR